MLKILLILACFLTLHVRAFEYQLQFENEQVSVARIKIFPHEEIALHRDVYPQIVVALKGGVITRLESDGRTIDVDFPTGIAIFRPSDREDQYHRSINNSDESVELIVIQLKKTNESNVVR